MDYPVKTIYLTAFLCSSLLGFSLMAQVNQPTTPGADSGLTIPLSPAEIAVWEAASNAVQGATIIWLPDQPAPAGQWVLAGAPGTLPLTGEAGAVGVPLQEASSNILNTVTFVYQTSPAVVAAAMSAALAAAQSGNSPQPLDSLGGCVRPGSGLIGWWQAEGNANDSAGSHPGQTPNSVSFVAGKVGQAFSLNGSNQSIQIPYTNDLATPGFSVEAWVNPAHQIGSQASVFGQAYGRHLVVSPGSGGLNVSFFVTDTNGTFYGVTSGRVIPLNQFTHLAGTWDGASLKLYTNGVLARSSSLQLAAIGNSLCPFSIGGINSCSYSGQYFPGLIDEVSLYNRALLTGEINAIYLAGSAGKCTTPPSCVTSPLSAVASWPGEGDASDMFDNNCPGTLQNGVTFDQGMVSRAFSFNGTNQAVEIPHTNSLVPATFSVEAWVKPVSRIAGGLGQASIFGQSYGRHLVVRNGGQGLRVAFVISNNGQTFHEVDSSGDIPTGEWSHLVGTWDGWALSLYINGALEQQATVNIIPWDSGCPFHIGGIYDPTGDCAYVNQFFHGLIDETTYYNQALSASDVAALYNAGGSGKCNSLGYWLAYYFGPDCWNQTYATATADADLDGTNNFQAYLTDTDPNKIRFSLSVTNQYVTNTAAPAQLNITAGVPSYIAVLVNTTNENWQAFTTSTLSVPTPTDGVYVVTVGLRGWAPTGARTWQTVTLFRDTSPLRLVLTNLPAFSGSRPFLDPAGYTTRALSLITWTLIDANANTNSGNGAVVGQGWSLSDPFHTTNWFQCVDLALAPGTNSISLRAVDWVGSVALTNFTYIFDTNGDSTPPSLTLLWPPDGTQVSGDSFTVRAWTDDDTAAVALQYTDANGMLQIVNGLIERGGNLWVPSVPLAAGTNRFSLVATDAAGNTRTNNFTVVQNSVALTITPVPERQMPFCSATVYVTVGAPAAAVTVNGLPGYSGDGLYWTVESVPLPPGGTVTLQATAQLTDGTTLQTLLTQERDPIVFTQIYDFKLDYSEVFMATGKVALATETYHTDFHWERGAGGTSVQSQYGSQPGPPATFSNVTVTVWPPDNGYLPSLQGQQVYFHYEDGELLSSSTSPAGLPDLQWMERSSTAGVVPGDFPVPYSESSEREVRRFTGGSPFRQQQGLFDLSASLTCESELDWDPADWAYWDGSSPFLQSANPPVDVVSEQICLGGDGNLGSDGHLWTVDADGQEIGGTAQGPPPSYQGQLTGQQKYRLHVLAQTLQLEPDVVVNGANFCVGQNVPFQLETPPAGVTATNFRWTLTGTYVNDHTNAGPGSSENYFQNANLLTNEVLTNCWWVSGGFSPPQTYQATVTYTLVSTNGTPPKSDVAKGRFNMYRPTATISALTTRVTVTNYNGQPQILFGVYQLLPGFDAPGITFYNTLTIPTDSSGYVFRGTNEWVQVNYSTPEVFQGINSTNYQKVQNGSDPYGDYPIPYQVFMTDPDTGRDTPYDRPKTPLPSSGFVRYEASDDFKMWMMFRPESGIAVPLSVVSWRWHGIATNSGTGTWGLASSPGDHTVDPVGTPTEVFPLWKSDLRRFHWDPPNSALPQGLP